MTQENIELYKNKLRGERDRILKEITETEKPVDFGSDIDHFDEETDESEAMSNQIAIANTLKARLGEIDIALEKTRTGRYGICEKCGKEIEAEILDIDPESRWCKRCKLSE